MDVKSSSEKQLAELRRAEIQGHDDIVQKPKQRRSMRAILGAALFVAALFQLSTCANWDDWGSIVAEPSGLAVRVRNAAVSSDVHICSEVGVDILKKGGNAVDAAVATGACLGTVNMFASGIGGGGFMVYRHHNGSSKSFNFREMAPGAAHRDMYHRNPIRAQVGGLAFAVPGEVDGFATAHQMYGKLPWRDLWQPSIDLARYGFPVPAHLSYQIHRNSDFFLQNLEDWPFVESNDRPGELIREGEILRRPQYAETLEVIAGDNGPWEFYNGKIARSLADYARENDGIVTFEDFKKYETIVTNPLNSTFLGQEVLTCPPPCSGAVLLEGLNIAELLDFKIPNDPVEYHRLVETMKWISAGRTELGDPSDKDVPNFDKVAALQTKEFAKSVVANISDDQTYSWEHYKPSYEANDPHGTSHYSILDEDGNAVAVTTTVNLYWGAQLHDPATGIVLNSEMDDFSIPGRSNAYNLKPSIYNYIKPFKRPLSSTAPTIIVNDEGKASFVIGGSGGSRIVTSVFQAIVKNYLWKYSLLETIKSPRAHHQLIPEVAYLESGVKEKLVTGLVKRGHAVQPVAGGSVLQGIRRYDSGDIVAVADFWRKGGKPAGY